MDLRVHPDQSGPQLVRVLLQVVACVGPDPLQFAHVAQSQLVSAPLMAGCCCPPKVLDNAPAPDNVVPGCLSS